MSFVRPCTAIALIACAAPTLAREHVSAGQPEVASSIVTVEVERRAPPLWLPLGAELPRPNLYDPLALDWLRPDAPRRGQGFVARADGLIVTTSDLVRDSGAITVRLADGRRLAGSVVAVDTSTRAAVLQVDASRLRPLQLPSVESPPLPGQSVLLSTRGGEACTGQRARIEAGTLLFAPGAEGVLAVFEASAEAPLGAPLFSAEGELLGLHAESYPLPLPLGSVTLVRAVPPSRLGAVLAAIPPRLPPLLPRLDWDGLGWFWDSLVRD